jgi:hypothetical protein
MAVGVLHLEGGVGEFHAYGEGGGSGGGGGGAGAGGAEKEGQYEEGPEKLIY